MRRQPECYVPSPCELGVQRGRIPALLRRGGRAGSGAGRKRFDASKLYLLTSFSAAHHYATAAGGGEAGVNTGFGALYLFYSLALDSGFRTLGGKATSITGDGGWWTDIGGAANYWRAILFSTTTLAVAGPSTNQMLPSDLFKLHALLMVRTPTSVDLYLDHTSNKATAAMAEAYRLTTTALAERLGILSAGGAPATNMCIPGRLTFRGTPTAAHLQALLDAARTEGGIPSLAAAQAAMPGTTITHRQSLRDTLALASAPVIDGQVGPDSLPDTVTAASVDAMARQGSPTVRVIDPTVDGRKTYGVLGSRGSSAHYASVGEGIRGDAVNGLHCCWRGRIWGAGNAAIAGNRQSNDSTVGWVLYMSAGTLLMTVKNAAGASVTTTGAAMTAYYGTEQLITAQCDGALLQVFVGATKVAESAIVGYKPPAASNPTRFGYAPSAVADVPAGDLVDHFEADGGDNVLTLAEIQAKVLAWQRTGKLALTTGKTQHRWDWTTDAAGGSVPTNVADRVDADGLVSVGANLMQIAQRVERLWAWEAA